MIYEGQSKIIRILSYSARLCLSSMQFFMQAGTGVSRDHDEQIYLLNRLLHVLVLVDKNGRSTSKMHQ